MIMTAWSLTKTCFFSDDVYNPQNTHLKNTALLPWVIRLQLQSSGSSVRFTDTNI